MLCAVYKSFRKSQTYIFVEKRNDFSKIPEDLLSQFGTPELVSMLNLKNDTKMALADATKVMNAIKTNGYYLQLPPPPIDYLSIHKNQQGNLNENDPNDTEKSI